MQVEHSFPADILYQKRGIKGLNAILMPYPLSSEARGQSPITMFDLDDTTKEGKKHSWSDGKSRKVLPETVAAFMALRAAGNRIGVITEQAYSEFQPWITDVAQLALGKEIETPHALFNGPIVLEGGSLMVNGTTGEKTLLVSDQVIRDTQRVKNWLKASIEGNFSGYGILMDTDPREGGYSTYVQLPAPEDQGEVSVSMWEQGPHITDPAYHDEYDPLRWRVDQALHDIAATSLKVFEAGNGTLRVVGKEVSKANAMRKLEAIRAVDLRHMTYACDGPNDVDFAKDLKSKGGGLIVVQNGVKELHQMADYSAQQPAGLGVAEAVSQIYPELYQQAMQSLQDRGLHLSNQ